MRFKGNKLVAMVVQQEVIRQTSGATKHRVTTRRPPDELRVTKCYNFCLDAESLVHKVAALAAANTTVTHSTAAVITVGATLFQTTQGR